MTDKRKPLGELFREQQEQQKAAEQSGRDRAAMRKLNAIDSELYVLASTLNDRLTSLLHPDANRDDAVIRLSIVPPFENFNPESDLNSLKDLLSACEEENVDISLKRGRVSKGLTERSRGYGTRPIMAHGFILTIDPSKKFSGLVIEETRRWKRPGHRPRP